MRHTDDLADDVLGDMIDGDNCLEFSFVSPSPLDRAAPSSFPRSRLTSDFGKFRCTYNTMAGKYGRLLCPIW